MAKQVKEYDMSIRCHYGKNKYTEHRQLLTLKDIEKWVNAYCFTHPEVESFSVKIWIHDRPTRKDD